MAQKPLQGNYMMPYQYEALNQKTHAYRVFHNAWQKLNRDKVGVGVRLAVSV